MTDHRTVHLTKHELDEIAEQVKEKLKAEFSTKVLAALVANFAVAMAAIASASGVWYTLSSTVDKNAEAINRLERVASQRDSDLNALKSYMDVRFDSLRSVLDARDITINNKIDEVNRWLRDHNNSRLKQ